MNLYEMLFEALKPEFDPPKTIEEWDARIGEILATIERRCRNAAQVVQDAGGPNSRKEQDILNNWRKTNELAVQWKSGTPEFRRRIVDHWQKSSI